MKNSSRFESGQALVIIVLAIFGLVGITGLAIDGGMAFSDRRHAQNAADTAALAGALAKINAQETMTEIQARAPMRVAALNRAASNGYANNLVTNTVEVYTCDEMGATCAAPYAGDSDYVQVIITSHLDTFFARVIGIPQVHNRVNAIALADDDDTGPLFDGRSIVALNPDCPPQGSMIVSGDSLITINGGGMWANADEDCAFKCTSTSVSVEIPDGGITSPAGSFDSVSAHCEEELNDDGITYGDSQMPYPPELPDLPVPAECNPAMLPIVTAGVWNDPIHGLVATSFLTPGYYGTFPPKKDSLGNNLEDHIFMQPGVYCVDTVLKLNSTNLHLYGDDITIWIRAGNGFTINGGIVQLYAANAGDYAGYLIIVEPDYSGSVTACTLEGNALNEYVGAIYAPHCDVTINGTADTPPDGIDSQIIGYNVTINGTANLTINYDDDNNPEVVDPPKTGVAR
jgi:Flp pilus assembly protein TadG